MTTRPRRPARPPAPRRAAAWALLGVFGATLPGSPAAWAAPQGEKVVSGEATFTRDGDTTTIDTTTRQTIVDYDSFDIERQETVRINQPDAGSKILNRTDDAVEVDGNLSSNGLVYILSPAGVFFGDNAVVDVSGLVAGAGHMSDEDFLGGVDRITGVAGDVTVAGGAALHAAQDVALVGRRVANFGAIRSEGGMIALVAGGDAVLSQLDGHLVVHIDGGGEAAAGQDFALVQAGEVDAGAGRVSLSAGDTWSLAMNHSGVTRAREIELEAQGGRVVVDGTLDARGSAPGETGGRITVTGEDVAVGGTLDASGDAGGGEIRVGGDMRGEGALRNARRTWVGPEAVLRADAEQGGDGGSLVVFATDKAAFHGLASARGGAQGGDGGFVELSGKQSLDVTGRVALSAPNGEAGTLLYDPNAIVIVGGTADGNDEPDAADDFFSGVNESAEPAPFEIHESEIEGTDANIVLEATNSISVREAFGDDVVVLVPGRSLVMRTTGGSGTGIDLTSDGNDTLAWKVSEGGTLGISTATTADGASGDIKIGRLIWDGRSHAEPDDPSDPDPPPAPGLETTNPLSGDAGTTEVYVTAQRGDVTIGSIEARGRDAAPGLEAEIGGDVVLRTQTGNVAVTGTIDASGGSSGDVGLPGEDPLPGYGERAGTVQITTADGGIVLEGDVTLDGGDGLAGKRGGVLYGGTVGGGGGRLLLTTGAIPDANDVVGPEEGVVEVHGNVSARGGEGRGFAVVGATQIGSVGGNGGQFQVIAPRGIRIEGGVGDPITLDLRGGDGAASGGSGWQAPAGQTDNKYGIFLETQALSTAEEPEQGDIVIRNANLIASGGDAGLDGGPGGLGGRASQIFISSDGARLLASDAVTVEANGGAGGSAVEGASGALIGGGAGSALVSLSGLKGAQVGPVSTRGGNGTNAEGGAGGTVTVTAGDGDVEVRDIDVTGGDAIVVGGFDEAVAGGVAGVVAVAAARKDADGAGGNVRIGGVVGGAGGTGHAVADGVLDPVAEGATVLVTADQNVRGNAPGARLRGSDIDVSAGSIGGDPGDADARLAVAGTAWRDDQPLDETAILVARGQLVASVAGNDLEALELQQQDIDADSYVYDAEDVGQLLLHVSGDDGDPTERVQTVETMQTGDDAPELRFRLDDQPPPSDPGSEPPALAGPQLRIAVGAVAVGANGGSLANGASLPLGEAQGAENAGAIVGAPGATAASPHVASAGDFRLEARTIGEDGTPIVVNGTPDGALRLDANGDVFVQMESDFGAVDVTQRNALGESTLDGLAGGGSRSTVSNVGTALAPVQAVDVTTTSAGFGYRLLAEAAPDPAASTPRVRVDRLKLGGSGLIDASGDLHIAATSDGPGSATITLDGDHDLVLRAGGDVTADAPAAGRYAIDLGTTSAPVAPGEDPDHSDLVFETGGGVGADGTALVTRHVDRLAAGVGTAAIAGAPTSGDFRIENQDERPDAPLEIAELFPRDPADLSGSDTTVNPVTGIVARANSEGDVEISNGDRTILLGAIPIDASGRATHVNAAGDVTLSAGAVEVGNAQYAAPATGNPNEDPEAELVATNRARLFATGDLVIDARIDTAALATAEDTRDVEDPLPTVDDVPGSLTLVSQQGRVEFRGDVGTLRPLGRLESSAARLPGDRSFRVNEAKFAALDGPGAATVVGTSFDGDADGQSRVTFAGDIGALERLAALDVEADAIRFSDDAGVSANSVRVGDGGIALDAADDFRDGVPATATISDRNGGLAIETSGDFRVGKYEKISVTGELSIAAASVRVADLSADRLRIDSDAITVVRREPGEVLLPDGSRVMDQGTDLVANAISFSSTPVIEGDPGLGDVRLYLGSGGLALPGAIQGFEIARYRPDLRAVQPSDFAGPAGRTLDLTGQGGKFAGNPSQQMARVESLRLPELPAPARGGGPAAGRQVDADRVLAFLRCASLAAGACDPDDAAALSAFGSLDDSALATPRAQEITERYHALVAAPGAGERLRAAFAEAGRAYGTRQEWRDGGFDGASFYHFLEDAGAPGAPARAAVRELAWLFAEIRLLGLDDADTRRLQRTLAQEFADAAGIPGFGPEQVSAAVGATEIGLPQ